MTDSCPHQEDRPPVPTHDPSPLAFGHTQLPKRVPPAGCVRHTVPHGMHPAASRSPDAPACCKSPRHSVLKPWGNILQGNFPGYLNGAVCAVRAMRGWHPQECMVLGLT